MQIKTRKEKYYYFECKAEKGNNITVAYSANSALQLLKNVIQGLK